MKKKRIIDWRPLAKYIGQTLTAKEILEKGGVKGMSRTPQATRVVYTVPEVAALLGINLPKAYELARQEGFPAIRFGRRIVVPKEAFHRWLEQVALDKQSYDIAGK